jgi:threonine dehydratase
MRIATIVITSHTDENKSSRLVWRCAVCSYSRSNHAAGTAYSAIIHTMTAIGARCSNRCTI